MGKTINPKLERRREYHGWSFMGLEKDLNDAILHYFETGEKKLILKQFDKDRSKFTYNKK
jgi:hypothetical protein